ncbi:phosphotransferase enzyme family protein [Ktedonobacter racemifer]|uniref:Aminoglycoside phosphotransferase n=1 Tax=Ktedonobacter racemifer DSM 44963 TaxID=485913 RepID=D6TTL8_KTERA|nr:phosphotransferase [Ktedonobacter racemifer]EFH83769.1 aminoglycoside phosphotransferase [Ktedonobacter racemifer DSM 44963]
MRQTLLPDELRTLVTQRYGLTLGEAKRLEGGDECLIWQVTANEGDVVVRLSPPWRSPERLTWTHRVTLALHEMLPQVVTPILALDGETLFRYQQQSVALFPYITGTQLDRDNSAHRQEAAHLLAHLHRALLNCAPMSATLERERLLGAPPLFPTPDPAELVDPELDAWHASLSGRYKRLTIGLIHGDYYRRNLLTRGKQLVGLLDWDDLHTDYLMQEVAWSTWELCHKPMGDDWYPEHVQDFVRCYREAGGPCQEEEYSHFIPFIRWRLREEMRRHYAAVARGLPGEPEYAAIALPGNIFSVLGRIFTQRKNMAIIGLVLSFVSLLLVIGNILDYLATLH